MDGSSWIDRSIVQFDSCVHGVLVGKIWHLSRAPRFLDLCRCALLACRITTYSSNYWDMGLLSRMFYVESTDSVVLARSAFPHVLTVS
jgi:hypothetical protein